MKYLKSFRLFEASNSGGWSIKDSSTAKIFSTIFGSLGFGIKSRKLKNIAKEYDEYLQVVYDEYLKERKAPVNKNNLTDKPDTIINVPKIKPEFDYNYVPEIEPKSNSNPDNERFKKEQQEFVDLGLDVHELEGLLHYSKTPEEVEKHLNELKSLLTQTQKDMDDIMNKISNGEDDENHTLANSYDKKKSKVDKINTILKKVKVKPNNSSSGYVNYFESIDWMAGAIQAPTDWSEEDKKNITAKVNPYKIEEFSLRKRSIVDSEEDQKKAKKLEHAWALLINDIHKKWFYVFEITKLDDKYKSTTKKESPAAVKSAKTLEVLKTSFNENSQLIYSASQIGFNKSYYVLSNFNNDLILLYKIEGSNKLFKVIGNMGISENKSKIDYFDSDKSSFAWNVNTNKYRNFAKDTFIMSDDINGFKYKLRMSTALGKDYPCIEMVDEAGYLNIVSYYKEGDEIKKSIVTIRQVPFSLYNVKETQHIDVKEPISEISTELKKSI